MSESRQKAIHDGQIFAHWQFQNRWVGDGPHLAQINHIGTVFEGQCMDIDSAKGPHFEIGIVMRKHHFPHIRANLNILPDILRVCEIEAAGNTIALFGKHFVVWQNIESILELESTVALIFGHDFIITRASTFQSSGGLLHHIKPAKSMDSSSAARNRGGRFIPHWDVDDVDVDGKKKEKEMDVDQFRFRGEMARLLAKNQMPWPTIVLPRPNTF